MSTKGYTVGTYIIKSEKKNSELPMCPICKKRVKSNSTIKKYYRMLKYVYEYANYKLYLVKNLFEGIDCIEKPKRR